MIEQIKNKKWLPVFTRVGFPYFILHLAMEGYVKDMKEVVGWGYRDQIIVSKNNLVSSYYSKSDADSFVDYIKNKDADFILQTNEKIRNKALLARQKLSGQEVSDHNVRDILDKTYRLVRNLYSVYRFPTLVDQLADDKIKLEVLEDSARTKDLTGKIFIEIDNDVLKKLQKTISRIIDLDDYLVLRMSHQELCESLTKRKSVYAADQLENRHLLTVLVAIDSQMEVYSAQDAREIVIFLDQINKQPVGPIKGTVANRGGILVGKVKVAYSAADMHHIEKGTVIVSPMTAIKFTPYLKGAKAIITDEGGLTCHAAIISRELGIPCIIGTKIATKVFKTGDKLKVDANLGIVKKI